MELSDIFSALGAWTQDTRILRLTTPLGPDKLLAESFQCVEGMNEGFRMDVAALSTDAAIELKSLLGQPILLELLTTDAGQPRPFHGHVTKAVAVGANGGIARYQLTVESWTAMLGYGRDSVVYQDMTVLDILESVFNDYQGQGALAPVWRMDIADISVYPKRSLTTQYQESDLDFVQRLLDEEGLFTWVEHEGDAASPTLGKHTLVIADHNGAFAPNAQSEIRFTQPGAVMEADSMDRWRAERRWQTNAIELQSWDYRQLNARPVSAYSSGENSSDSMPLVSRDTPGAYSYESRAQGQRIADRQLQALEVQNKLFTGAGTVRTLSPGTCFTLQEHAVHDLGSEDDRSFVALQVVHQAHNNLSADLHAHVAQSLGLPQLETGLDLLAHLPHAADLSKGERPLYRNRIEAIRSKTPYRHLGADAHGQVLHPKPTVFGQQTALVVGPQDGMVYTDRDHRIKVQFHWQRGGSINNGHSRLAHPSQDGHAGAPANEQAGTWVRIATSLAPTAGANWGSNAVPRVGQEVLIDFIEGDIDRPVVIGCLYNGQGQKDAQHNQLSVGAGSSTGNAPAWFPGESGAHAHSAALSGIKSQAMGASQLGAGAYNQLVFDDTPGESRTSLQSHAGAHDGASELNLGHLRHQTDNQRLNMAGFGSELKSQHSLAVRAGQGILLSTDARPSATGQQLDSTEALAQAEAGHALQLSLASLAQKQNARLKDEKKQDEPGPQKLAAISGHAHTAAVLQAKEDGSGEEGGGGHGSVTAYSEPHIQFSSPAGIAATTPANAIFSASNTSSIAAQDINFAAQGGHYHAVKAGISVFTYGKLDPNTGNDKPNQETGIKLHAAQGKFSMQSQSDETKITADKKVSVSSVTSSVNIAAPKHVLLTAQGAYLKLEGGNIMLHGPGKLELNGSMKELAGPASSRPQLPDMPREKLYAGHFQILDKTDGQPIAGRLYRKKRADGRVFFGRTDSDGKTQSILTAEPENLQIFLEQNEKFHRSKVDEDEINAWFNEE